MFLNAFVFAQLAGLGIAAILAIIFILVSIILIFLHAIMNIRPATLHLGWAGALCFVVAFAILTLFS